MSLSIIIPAFHERDTILTAIDHGRAAHPAYLSSLQAALSPVLTIGPSP